MPEQVPGHDALVLQKCPMWDIPLEDAKLDVEILRMFRSYSRNVVEHYSKPENGYDFITTVREFTAFLQDVYKLDIEEEYQEWHGHKGVDQQKKKPDGAPKAKVLKAIYTDIMDTLKELHGYIHRRNGYCVSSDVRKIKNEVYNLLDSLEKMADYYIKRDQRGVLDGFLDNLFFKEPIEDETGEGIGPWSPFLFVLGLHRILKGREKDQKDLRAKYFEFAQVKNSAYESLTEHRKLLKGALRFLEEDAGTLEWYELEVVVNWKNRFRDSLKALNREVNSSANPKALLFEVRLQCDGVSLNVPHAKFEAYEDTLKKCFEEFALNADVKIIDNKVLGLISVLEGTPGDVARAHADLLDDKRIFLKHIWQSLEQGFAWKMFEPYEHLEFKYLQHLENTFHIHIGSDGSEWPEIVLGESTSSDHRQFFVEILDWNDLNLNEDEAKDLDQASLILFYKESNEHYPINPEISEKLRSFLQKISKYHLKRKRKTYPLILWNTPIEIESEKNNQVSAWAPELSLVRKEPVAS